MAPLTQGDPKVLVPDQAPEILLGPEQVFTQFPVPKARVGSVQGHPGGGGAVEEPVVAVLGVIGGLQVVKEDVLDSYEQGQGAHPYEGLGLADGVLWGTLLRTAEEG